MEQKPMGPHISKQGHEYGETLTMIDKRIAEVKEAMWKGL